MTTLTAQQAYDKIVAYIKPKGLAFNKWYVGVASDPVARLFTDHQVPKQGTPWIYEECQSDAAARKVEESLLQLGCKGGGGGGDQSTTSVYAYVITSQTKE